MVGCECMKQVSGVLGGHVSVVPVGLASVFVCYSVVVVVAYFWGWSVALSSPSSGRPLWSCGRPPVVKVVVAVVVVVGVVGGCPVMCRSCSVGPYRVAPSVCEAVCVSWRRAVAARPLSSVAAVRLQRAHMLRNLKLNPRVMSVNMSMNAPSGETHGAALGLDMADMPRRRVHETPMCRRTRA